MFARHIWSSNFLGSQSLQVAVICADRLHLVSWIPSSTQQETLGRGEGQAHLLGKAALVVWEGEPGRSESSARRGWATVFLLSLQGLLAMYFALASTGMEVKCLRTSMNPGGKDESKEAKGIYQGQNYSTAD